MMWLRNWLSKSSERPAKVSSNSFRPKVESLDDRIVPSGVSTAITNIGTFNLAVNTNNVLVALDATGHQIATTSFTNVRTVQAFRDGLGGLGADVVFLDGSWLHFDNSFGGATTFSAAQVKSQFGGLILDAGTAYNDKGQIRIDLLISANNTVDSNGNTFANALGSVSEFNQATGGGLQDLGLGQNVLWLSTYNAADGGTGIAIGQVNDPNNTPNNAGDDMLLVRKADSASGLATLYNGTYLFSPAAIVEYSQTTSLPVVGNNGLGAIFGNGGNSNNTTRMVVIDVTFEGSTTGFVNGTPVDDTGYALQFTSGGAAANSNLLGGLSLVPNVVGIISPDNTIETGTEYPGA